MDYAQLKEYFYDYGFFVVLAFFIIGLYLYDKMKKKKQAPEKKQEEFNYTVPLRINQQEEIDLSSKSQIDKLNKAAAQMESKYKENNEMIKLLIDEQNEIKRKVKIIDSQLDILEKLGDIQ